MSKKSITNTQRAGNSRKAYRFEWKNLKHVLLQNVARAVCLPVNTNVTKYYKRNYSKIFKKANKKHV